MTPPADPEAGRRPGRGLFFLLIAGTSLGPLTVNILMPAMPSLVTAFNATVEAVQLTLSLYLVGLSISQLIHGALSDHFGRRPVMIAGFALALVASLAALAATSIEGVIFARFMQAFGASTGLVIGRAIVRDLYDRDQAAAMIGWVTMAMLVVPMVAPTIGGLLDTAFGWRAIFIFVGAFAGLLVVWSALRLPETRATTSAGGGVARFGRDATALLADRTFVGYALGGAFCSATFFSFLGGAPHVVVAMMGHTSAEYGLWFAATAVAYALGNFITARFSIRFGSVRLAAIGGLVAAVGAVIMFAAVSWVPPSVGPAIIFIPQMIMSVANGLMLPSLVAGAVSARPEAAGAAAGITGFLQMGLSAAMAQLVGHALAQATTPLPMVYVVFGCALGALAAFGLLVAPRRGA